MNLLNVGSGGKNTQIPPWYAGWDVVRLDVDPKVAPDILMDARKVGSLPGRYDAIYCSHNLEHYSPSDGIKVVKGMLKVLDTNGFADIRVPDVGEVMEQYGQCGWDLDTVLYQSSAGPICVRDMLYGFERQIECAEHPEFMMHKNAFSGRTLELLLKWCGFYPVYTTSSGYDLRCVGFKAEPSDEMLASIGLVRE